MGMDKVNVMSDIRAEFEAFIILPPHEKEISRFPEDGSSAWPGSYKNLIVDLAWDAWQASRQALEGEPVAYAHEDENREDVITSKVKAFLSGLANHGGGFHRPVDIGERYTIPLYTHPVSADVPEKWRTVMKELADDLESEIEARRSGDLDRRIERDLIVVKEARVLLDEQEPGQ